jgi:hypothetical protein
MGVIDMVEDTLGRRGPFGAGAPFGHHGLFGHQGPFGHRGPFGYGTHWRARRRSRWPQILLGLLILAVVYALLSRDDRRSSWW